MYRVLRGIDDESKGILWRRRTYMECYVALMLRAKAYCGGGG
jgi:hypothetical protein